VQECWRTHRQAGGKRHGPTNIVHVLAARKRQGETSHLWVSVVFETPTGKTRVVALIDSGSSQNFIGQRLAYDWHLGAGEEPPAGPKTVDGTPLRVFRSCLLEFRQNHITCKDLCIRQRKTRSYCIQEGREKIILILESF
jgi:hypothetical protein